jgi:hypothetical protein
LQAVATSPPLIAQQIIYACLMPDQLKP